jgi:hypothetical protein
LPDPPGATAAAATMLACGDDLRWCRIRSSEEAAAAFVKDRG